MSETAHRAALVGNEEARAAEEARLYLETEVVDTRQVDHGIGGHACYWTVVHEPHDYETETWCEPHWVNPRTVRLHWCAGVQDQTPYPKVVTGGGRGERGLWVWQQDEAAGRAEFPFCRRLIVSPSPGGSGVNVQVEIWKGPPREWPPVHVGSNGAGTNIGIDEVRALRDWLSSWLDEQEEQDEQDEQSG
jgi:hypothetical protein